MIVSYTGEKGRAMGCGKLEGNVYDSKKYPILRENLWRCKTSI